MGEDVDVQNLAKITSGFSGADIAKVCNDAASASHHQRCRGGEPRLLRGCYRQHP
ncbi:MAG: hypothetical protein L6U16_04770 [Porphyromonadaceae bacterium]|nr:MAG: hypothetical protein L6U16_04770 [Porphyromonadaceae bacterium]